MRGSGGDQGRWWPTIKGVVSVLGLGLLLAACGEAGEASAFLVRDSAGIQIAESIRPAWEAGAGWVIGSEPLLKLGVVEGDPSQQFDGVTGLARLNNGTVVVADGGSQEIRYFGPAGDLLAMVGGPGEGPGEFTGLSGFGRAPGGALWAYDFSLRRITWLDGSGNVLDLVSLGSEPPVLNSVGVLPDGTFVLKQLWGAAQVAQAQESGLRRDPVAFVRFDDEGVLVDTLDLVPGREVYLTDENGRGVMSTPPFARNSVGAPWSEGLVVGTQDSFELMEYSPSGEVTRIVRIPSWDLRFGAQDLEEYIQGRLDQVSPERQPALRTELEAMPVPSSKPPYGGVLVDEEGNLWAAEWVIYPQVPARWNVLDSAGRWLGEVSVAGRFHPYAMGADWVLGVEWDDLDVEYVVLYPILKGMG